MAEQQKKPKVGIVGSGSWATALSKILLNNVDSINWWVREEDVAQNLHIYGRNPLYLSSVGFNRESLNIYTDISKLIAESDHIIFVIPAAFMKKQLSGIAPNAFKGKKVHSAIKGIIPETNQIIAEFFISKYGMSSQDISVISGPSHAEEIALEKLTYLTVSSMNPLLSEEVAALLGCKFVKTTTSDDIYGTEYASVLKNIYAIAVGITKGLGYGDNFISVLVANALQEMERFIAAVHPIDRNLSGSVYLGDLIVTAYSQFSRNRTFGNMIGAGYSVKSAQLEMKMIAEGYYATRCIHEINKKYNVEMPIASAVYNILYESISPYIEIKIMEDRIR